MQDFHPLPDRIFSGEEGAADGGGELQRLVGYPAGASASRQPTPPQQPVKCPRCHSTNTKFCYYNNYNLAQPRHFCKSCRRYWTMGGVLRNVPVGGGCRKSKRPSSSSKPSSLPSPASADKDHPRRRRPAAAASSLQPGITVIASASFPDPPLPTSQIPISDTDAPLHPAPAIFQDPAAGGFSETPAALLGFGFPDPSPAAEKTEAEAIGPEVTHPTLQVDLQPIGAGDGLPALDLSGPVDPGLFDLTTTVDPSAYWNQSHWMDADPSLYLPRLGVGGE